MRRRYKGVRDFRRSGLTTDNGRCIVDGPRSNRTRLVLDADHVAYAVFRYFHALDSNYLNVVLNRFPVRWPCYGRAEAPAGEQGDCHVPGLPDRACLRRYAGQGLVVSSLIYACRSSANATCQRPAKPRTFDSDRVWGTSRGTSTYSIYTF